MAKIRLTYNARNKIAQNTIRYILSLGIFKEVSSKSPIEISLEEAKKGKINTYKNVDAFFDKILK